MTAGAAKRLESVQQPLALHPVGSIPVADGIALLEDEDGAGSVFIWGQAAWAWDASDSAARRLCAVQLVNADAADQRAVAASFGVNETTVWRWRNDYSGGGVSALLPQIHGPKGPSKLTEEKCAEIQRLRAEGKIAHVGLSNVTVSEIEEARRIVPVVSVQNRWNPGDRAPETDGVLATCSANAIAFLPYSPFGGASGARRLSAGKLAAEAKLREMSPHRLVLAWMLAKSPAVITIPGARRIESIADSAGAADVTLSEADVSAIERAFGR